MHINREYIYTHLDVYENGTYFVDETKDNNSVISDFYSYFRISYTTRVIAKGIDVAKHQEKLILLYFVQVMVRKVIRLTGSLNATATNVNG